jgi:hypothetical protein
MSRKKVAAAAYSIGIDTGKNVWAIGDKPAAFIRLSHRPVSLLS